MNTYTDKQKEIDKRVYQEIKNHTDYMQNINQEVQSLKKEIQSLKSEMLLLKAQHSSQIKDISITWEVHRDKLDMLNRDMKSYVDKYLLEILERQKQFDDYIDQAIKKRYLNWDDISVCFNQINAANAELSLRIERNYNAVKSESDHLKNYINSKINTVHEKIDNCPNDFEVYANQVDALLEENTVNMQGFRQELERLKKDQFMNSRNIEAIIAANKELLCPKKD